MQAGPVVGLRRYGVPPGGAFDRESMMLANALLHRPPDAPVLELVLMGATLDVLEHCNVAVVGASSPISTYRRWSRCRKTTC